jgi:hypothetical protein
VEKRNALQSNQALTQTRAPHAGEVLLFRGPDHGVQQPYLLWPLDSGAVRDTLRTLGFRAGLTVPGAGGQASRVWSWPQPGHTVHASTHYLDGALTRLSVSLHGTELSAVSTTIVNALVELAFQLDARLVSGGTLEA